ncbi:hypothetical protein [Peribacillus asahii]|uniref:hypothetical protein n=1 Tax=Peribacillus asahii TaxID=228899 RepID=UPI00207A27B4|nr:hypothetical protein [Peribacillus asahii]USK83415.1 hypothetical protein LIT35_13120 [Peribacillus asahii]
MTSEQGKQLNEIISQQDRVVKIWMDYQKRFSNVQTWHFGGIVLMLIVPLIIIYFCIDKRKVSI